jgi:phytoene dehydrogenase-like protein
VSGQYDAIVIGGGHNGLVAACYLARANRKVLVLERRDVLGGACVTEENVFAGYKVSTAAYVNSLFRPEIVRDLRLRDYGFETLERNPASFTPFDDGRYLMLGVGPREDLAEIAKFSRRDAERYPQYERMLGRVASAVEPLLASVPPNVARPGLRDFFELVRTGLRFRRLGPGLGEAVELLAGAARPLLDRWFESEQLKATLATDAIIGAFASPSMPGTAYVLFHHVMGETNGKKGVWSYVRGGMGGLTRALAEAARALGAEIRTEAEVAKILVKDGAAVGVALRNGDEFGARAVASSLDCHQTFEVLVNPAMLPPAFAAALKRIDYRSASVKINVALAALPDFSACPGRAPAPQHRGTIHLCPDQNYIERAYDDAKYGRRSHEPVVECTIPSAIDPTVAPPGRQLMSMFCQYAPYELAGGKWDDAARNAFADRCFGVLERCAPGFTSSVLDRQILVPPDLEERFGLTGGNIFQGALSLDNLFVLRPGPGYAAYRTPLRHLYLCGSAAHPGGGVTGAPGRNAARVMLASR